MSENACTYSGQREEALVAYIYGEMAPSEHLAFASHIEDCVRCQTELNAFTATRKQLESWAPPELSGTLAQLPVAAPTVPAKRWAVLHDLPAWAQAVAALLVIGVAAGAANLRVTYGTDGLSVRTGWFGQENPAVVQPATPPTALPAQSEPFATRAELAALEQALRGEIGTTKDARGSVIRETRSLLADSERRQQNELALRMGVLAQDFQLQREADNAKINRVVGQYWSDANIQTRRLESAYSQLAVKVSQQR